MFSRDEFHSKASQDLQDFEGNHKAWPDSKQLQSLDTHQMLYICINSEPNQQQKSENKKQIYQIPISTNSKKNKEKLKFEGNQY